MSVLAIVLVILGLCGLLALALLGLALLLPAATQAAEKVRIEREVADASWRIHQRASEAFGRMLDSARGQSDDER